MNSSTGCRLMALLNSCQVSSSTEDLHVSDEETPPCACRAKRKHKFSVWYLATWNVRSVLDVEGSVETARQGSEAATSEDRRIDQVVGVLDRYGVVVGALQETKWFGSEVYKVGESLVLTTGREVPGAGHVRQRGEGATIVLSGPAIGAWKAGA